MARRQDFLAQCVNVEVTAAGAMSWAFVDWAAAAVALRAGRLPCSDGERQVLLLAVSMAEGVPVDLRAALVGLDQATTVLVAEAVLHAAGHRHGVIALEAGAAR